MQGQMGPSMKERLESLKNLSMLMPSDMLLMDLFTKTKYYSLKLTITWEQVYSETPYESAADEVTYETSRKSKTEECVVKWAAGGSLEKELKNVRPRKKWQKLSDDSGRIFVSSNSLELLQAQVENETIHSVRLTLKVANVYVDTKTFSGGCKFVYVDGERQPWWRSTA